MTRPISGATTITSTITTTITTTVTTTTTTTTTISGSGSSSRSLHKQFAAPFRRHRTLCALRTSAGRVPSRRPISPFPRVVGALPASPAVKVSECQRVSVSVSVSVSACQCQYVSVSVSVSVCQCQRVSISVSMSACQCQCRCQFHSQNVNTSLCPGGDANTASSRRCPDHNRDSFPSPRYSGLAACSAILVLEAPTKKTNSHHLSCWRLLIQFGRLNDTRCVRAGRG